MDIRRARRCRFLCALAGMWWVFLAMGMLVPLLPGYVEGPLGASTTVVGISVLLYAISGVLSRPAAAVLLRLRTPWTLMATSCLVGAAAVAATPALEQLGWFYFLRFVEGFAVGLFYTAAATSVVRDTPPASRGSILSYFSVPLFLGIAVGPIVGDRVIEQFDFTSSWAIAGALMCVALPTSIIPLFMRTDPHDSELMAAGARYDLAAPALTRTDLWQSMVHPAALVPAVVMALVITGWAGFQAYVPLYGPTIGMEATGTVFLVYAVVVLVIRVGGARLFDVLPLAELVAVGLVANVGGLVLAWAWRDPVALYIAAALLAVAVGMMFVTLMRMALAGAAPHEEPAIVGAYTVAYDVGAGLGALALGLVITATDSYTSAFIGGALAGTLAIVIFLLSVWPARHRYTADQLSPQT